MLPYRFYFHQITKRIGSKKTFPSALFFFFPRKEKSLTGTHGVPVCLRKAKMVFFGLAEKRKELQFAFWQIAMSTDKSAVLVLSP